MLRFHNITTDDMKNGEGLRTVLWLSGCNHHCKGCHNSFTWNPEMGMVFDEAAKEELWNKLNKDYISGLTLSGGDPLFPGNREAVIELLKEMKNRFPNKNCWLYTGYTYEEIKDLPVMEYVDVVVDGPYVEELRSPNLPWVGSSNQRVIRIDKGYLQKRK